MKKRELFPGVTVVIEHPAGSTRRGVAPDGTRWAREMKADYGYIEGTKGADGEPIDCFIAPGNGMSAWLFSGSIFVIDQVRPDGSGLFDESKVVVGTKDAEAAKRLYLAHYPDGWMGFGSIKEMTWSEFWEWSRDPDASANPASLPYRNAPERQQGRQQGAREDAAGARPSPLPDGERFCPSCGVNQEWGGDECNRCGAADEPVEWAALGPKARKKASQLYTDSTADSTADGTAGDSVEETAAEVFTASADDAGSLVIVGDAAPGRLMRVRQYAMQSDARNKNDRIYPRAVVQSAVDEVRPAARAGAVLCELEHPTPVKADGEEKFVDNGPQQKTARVTDVLGVDAEGRVFVERDILDTPAGRHVADRIRSGKPYGISTRFKMLGRRRTLGDGSRVVVAERMTISTWDDVERPAVDGAGHRFVLLTDSVRAELGLPATTDSTSDSTPTGAAAIGPDATSPAPAGQRRERSTRVKDAIKRNIAALLALAASGAALDTIHAKRQEIGQQIKLASDAGEDIGDAASDALEADAKLSGIPGYKGAGMTAVEPGGQPGGEGFAPDVTEGAAAKKGAGMGDGNNNSNNNSNGNDKPAGDGLTDEERAFLREQRENAAKATADAERKKAVADVVEKAKAGDALKGLSADAQQFVIDSVLASNPDPSAVEAALASAADGYMKLASKERLQGRGLGAGQARGNTVDDPSTQFRPEGGAGGARAGGRIEGFRDRGPSWGATVDNMLAAADDAARRNVATGGVNPDDPEQQSIRAYNRRAMQPVLRGVIERREKSRSVEEFVASIDAEGQDATERAISDCIRAAAGERAAFDAVAVANLYNHPALLTAILVQSFQDLKMLQFVEAIGPGAAAGGGVPGGGWFDTGLSGQGVPGTELRIPTEYFVQAGGWSASGPQEDLGSLYPENAGLNEHEVRTAFFSAYPQFRRFAIGASKDVVARMGLGPLNYPVIGRHLYHIGLLKQRTIDRAIGDEMYDTADEFNAATRTNESVTLATNSVHNGAGSITVNLNPTKNASAAVTAGDPAVTYGTGVVGAVRVLGAGTGGAIAGAADGTAMIVRPRTRTVVNQGVLQTSTLNPVTVSAPAAAVRGYIDDSGNVASFPGTTATYAVDFNNGVIVFASGVAGAAGILTTAVTVTYAYVTNYDAFNVTNPTLPTGRTLQEYLSGLLYQIDVSAARMGSSPRFIRPDLLLCSLNASVHITTASIFHEDASPKGTDLYPTSSFFASRNGVNMARTNAPTRVNDTRLLLTVRGATKYGVADPFQVYGPYPKYAADGSIVPADVAYAQELSLITTPQVVDQNGVIRNPVSRTIRLR